MKKRNVTLALPDNLLGRVKVVAAKRELSISAILVRALHQIVEEDEGYGEARRGMLEDMRKGYELGTRGKINWTRESVHER